MYAVPIAERSLPTECSLVLVALTQAMELFTLFKFLSPMPDKEISLCCKSISYATGKINAFLK